jgi:hypothetical protein
MSLLRGKKSAVLLAAVFVLSACISSARSTPTSLSRQSADRPHINVMAPLVIGNPADMNSVESTKAWQEFRLSLAEMKKLGAYAVTTDVWWGLIEPQDNQFAWDYYDQMSDEIVRAGLKWIPILSTHQCGGNVGDDCSIPIPSWLWTKYASETAPVQHLQYVSEQGNASAEVLSAWATPLVLADYVEMYKAFQSHFARHAPDIAEVNISLGPSGELRFPSYNSHDQESGYPTRGAFQSYSAPAVAAWLAWAGERKLGAAAASLPPISMEKWIKAGHHKSALGRCYLEWYQEALLAHGRKLLSAAVAVFQAPDAAFRRADLGAKIPGIHWRIGTVRDSGRLEFGDRLAEASAGLIRYDRGSWKDPGRGYAETIRMFREVAASAQPGSVVLHFTALEMEDGQDKPEVMSLARSLVLWVGEEARRQKVRVKGENALGWNVPNPAAWVRMASHVRTPENPAGLYEGLTILRMSDVLASEDARKAFSKLARGSDQ